MKTLIVGTGALGGVIVAHLLAAGASVSLATRSATAAEEIKASGLRVTGLGGNLTTEAGDVARLGEYSVPGRSPERVQHAAVRLARIEVRI